MLESTSLPSPFTLFYGPAIQQFAKILSLQCPVATDARNLQPLCKKVLSFICFKTVCF